MDRGLVTARIHQSPIRTPLNTHRYLVPASLIGGGLRGVRNASRPAQASPGSGGKGDKELAWRHRGNGTSSGARAGRPRLIIRRGLSRPPTPEPDLPSIGAGLGGTTPARDLGRKVGGKRRGGERERETDGRVSPTPWHATIWSSASWMARSSDAGRWHWTHKLLQHHTVDDLLDAAFPGQQPSAAGVPELVSHHEGPAVLPQLQRMEALAVLLVVRPTRWRMARFRSS